MSPPLFFQAILRLLVLTALGALYFAEVASLPALGGIAALAVGSWWVEEIRAAVPGVRRIWDVCTIAFLGYATLDLLVLADSSIVAVIHLLLFLMIYKLYNAQSHRDFLHLFVLTFLALVAASTLTAHFGLLLVFSLYMILAIWGLALLQLKRETELHLPERSRDLLGAPGLVAPSFLISGFGMAFLALVLTLGIFFLIPRVGRTFLSLRGALGTQATGFTDRVDLGMYGAIQTDPTIVMRVSFPEDPNAPARSPDLRWRGVAFDRFDGRTWSLADSGRSPARQIREGQYTVSPFAVGSPFVSAEIFLEPIGTDVLFGPPRLRAIQGRLPGLRVDGAGGVTLPFPPNSRLRYLAVSQPERVRDGALRHATRPGDYPAEIRAAYLQLPALPARIRALAESLSAEAATPIDAVRKVEAYLVEHQRYSLDLGRDAGRDPLEDFLFERKTGNCEYFAASLVVLLRAMGIPARVVNGFQRGEWNEVGQYLAVRQRDAHSWAEVFFPDAGWITFDPSPRAAFETQVFGVSGRFGKYFDSLRWRWNRYVVDYNVGDQVAVAIRLRQQSLTLRRGLAQAWDRWTFEAYRSARRHWRSYGYIVAALVVLIAATAMLVRRTPFAGRGADWLLTVRLRRSPVAFYERMLRVLRRRGCPRPPAVTAREFLAGLGERPHFFEPAAELTVLYERVRFGGHALTPAEGRRAAVLLRQLEAAPR